MQRALELGQAVLSESVPAALCAPLRSAGGQAFGWIVGLIPITLAGGIGLLLLLFSFWLWLGTTTIEVLNRELHIRSGCLGISRSRVIPASTIREFQLDPSVQAGQDILYDLKLKLASGRSAVAAGGMEKREAEWLRAELKKDLGIHDGVPSLH